MKEHDVHKEGLLIIPYTHYQYRMHTYSILRVTKIKLRAQSIHKYVVRAGERLLTQESGPLDSLLFPY